MPNINDQYDTIHVPTGTVLQRSISILNFKIISSTFSGPSKEMCITDWENAKFLETDISDNLLGKYGLCQSYRNTLAVDKVLTCCTTDKFSSGCTRARVCDV